VDLGQIWTPEGEEIKGVNRCEGGGEDGGKPWEEIIHQLTARSVIRDFEKMAERESNSGNGDDY